MTNIEMTTKGMHEAFYADYLELLEKYNVKLVLTEMPKSHPTDDPFVLAQFVFEDKSTLLVGNQIIN
jgi:hypothetical protein